jgi:hypothetical protein
MPFHFNNQPSEFINLRLMPFAAWNVDCRMSIAECRLLIVEV